MNGIRDRHGWVQRLNPEGNNLMASLLRKFLNNMNVLTRKVLMNKENLHLIPSEALQRFCLVLEFAQQQLQIRHLTQLDVRREAHAHLQGSVVPLLSFNFCCCSST